MPLLKLLRALGAPQLQRLDDAVGTMREAMLEVIQVGRWECEGFWEGERGMRVWEGWFHGRGRSAGSMLEVIQVGEVGCQGFWEGGIWGRVRGGGGFHWRGCRWKQCQRSYRWEVRVGKGCGKVGDRRGLGDGEEEEEGFIGKGVVWEQCWRSYRWGSGGSKGCGKGGQGQGLGEEED